MKLTASFLFVASTAQQIGKQKANVHLPMTVEECSSSGCTPKQQGVTLDANWRWVNHLGTYANCYDGTAWDKTLCPDPKTCTENCGLEGVPKADWAFPYGISSDGNGLTLDFVVKDPKTGDKANVGSRTYMMDGDDKYKMFKLKNREFTFDVDVSKLPCGVNGALYFVEMQEDGGMSEFPTDKAGAAYGTGYCDAQCPHDVKFISGEANMLNWTNSEGQYGSCCNEMDIWEANQMASAYTPHNCIKNGPYRAKAGEDICDTAGCDFNSYRMGDKTFYGPGSNFAIDSTKPMTVITQFHTTDGTDTGDLSEIRRVYVQDGKVVPLRNATIAGLGGYDSVSDEFCTAQKKIFGDADDFGKKGGLKAMGETLDRGMVLVMSLWDDHDVNMLWLDSNFPTDQPATDPGVARGPCSVDSGKPADVESQHADANVKYSNVKYGAIGSTFVSGPTPPPAPGPAPGPAPAGTCTACGYNCDANCNCGRCNLKPGCDSSTQCLGACNSGGNAKWCGGGTTPTPAPGPPPPAPVTPTPAPAPGPEPGCPGGSLTACLDLCPSNPPAAYKACVQECTERCK